MLRKLANQIFDLLGLLKGSLHLSKEDALDGAQLLLDLLLLFARIERVERFQVFQKHVADILQRRPHIVLKQLGLGPPRLLVGRHLGCQVLEK